MCVLHAYLWKLLASLSSCLSYPSLCKIDPPANVAVNAMGVRRTSLFWRTGERSERKRNRKGSRATILRDGAESAEAVSKKRSRSRQSTFPLLV